ncbi:MAG: hypothetical protein KDB53_18215, partial [Planctomycetes bacterium]|nr:hypothetical protein [Planctomycetota bacterium]
MLASSMGRRRKKKVTFGDLVREQARAENAMVEAPCPVADCCGGCTLQDVEYTRQLLAKKALIEELFAKEG